MTNSPPEVCGVDVDYQTRCVHYHGATDVIAIKMKCCGIYYACKDCHNEQAQHGIEVWPVKDWNQKAILCGVCGFQLTINEYLNCKSSCPACHAPFNPECRNHYHYYFATDATLPADKSAQSPAQ